MIAQNPQDLRSRQSLLEAKELRFPYLYRFPGQEKSEQILYATRTGKSILYAQYACLIGLVCLMLAVIWMTGRAFTNFLNFTDLWQTFAMILSCLCILFAAFAWYWLTVTWQKTVGILTTYRLIKIIQINPFFSRTQMLPLKEVVDTSAGKNNFWGSLFGLSTFTARSSATSSGLSADDGIDGKLRFNKKYFYLENITSAGDLENYLHKVLKLLGEKGTAGLMDFRPFAAKLRVGQRDQLEQEYPEYWT